MAGRGSRDGIAVHGAIPSGGNGYAGYFDGKVRVNGTLSASDKQFQIDHPLDPGNKYLNHASVESSEMMTMYTGNAVLDSNGEAWVELPNWFEALNQDFRYHLTALGAPGPNLYVAQEISGNRFQIAGGNPGGKVSWQVTGTRHDPYALRHPLSVEEEKPGIAKGTYIDPGLYGLPETMSLGWLQDPDRINLTPEEKEQPR